MNVNEDDIKAKRKELKVTPVYKMVDTCAAEFEAVSAYYYSTYDTFDEVAVSDKKKIMVIGSGPIRIGQGIEFDYCTVHSIYALQELGYETIIVNNNPETVSTDFSVADKLYFEPLTEEDVMNIIEKEQPEGIVLQFGGQTSIKLAKFAEAKNIRVIGTQPKWIDAAEDREKFDEITDKLGVKKPKGKAIWNTEDGVMEAAKLEYPVLVRPSYVLGGQGMEITYDEMQLRKYLDASFDRDPENPILVDKYLNGIEIEVDAICDGEEILIPGIMEHLERAGIHSGDSITVYPSQNISKKIEDTILDNTEKLAKALNVSGMINIQFIAYKGEVYVIEVNPRSSRTVPYISKVTGVPMIDLATKCMLGHKLKDLGFGTGIYKKPNIVSVKVPVFSTEKLGNVEVSLGPEMRSTGEVLGVGHTYEEAIYKGLIASNKNYVLRGKRVLVTINDIDKLEFLSMAQRMVKLGYQLKATGGTYEYLKKNGIESEKVNKLDDESPNILDVIKNRGIDILINTPTKANDSLRDGFRIRRTAIEYGVEVLTSLDTLNAVIRILEDETHLRDVEVIDISTI